MREIRTNTDKQNKSKNSVYFTAVLKLRVCCQNDEK